VVKVPAVMHRKDDKVSENWAWPVMPFAAKDAGIFFPPDKGDFVWVIFEGGRPEYPLYIGGWWAKGETAEEWQSEGQAEDKKFVRGVKTKAGHEIRFDDREGKEKVVIKHKGNSHVSLLDNGSVIVASKTGQMVYLNADSGEITIINSDGNTITLGSSGIVLASNAGSSLQVGNTLQLMAPNLVLAAGSITFATGGASCAPMGAGGGGGAGSEPAVLGNKLVALLTQLITAINTHIHTAPGGSGGPTSPPTPPITPPNWVTALSQKFKIM